MVGSFDEKSTTHVVTRTDEAGCVVARTGKFAQGVLSGKWVVSFQWVLDSFAAQNWLPEARYAVRASTTTTSSKNTESPVLRAREELAQGKPRLFHDTQFLLAGGVEPKLRTTLASIIATGGGVLLSKAPPPPTHAEELLEDSSRHTVLVLAPRDTTTVAEAQKLYLDTGRRPLACDYVMDCVSCYAVLHVRKYELEVVEETSSLLSLLDNIEPSLQL